MLALLLAAVLTQPDPSWCEGATASETCEALVEFCFIPIPDKIVILVDGEPYDGLGFPNGAEITVQWNMRTGFDDGVGACCEGWGGDFGAVLPTSDSPKDDVQVLLAGEEVVGLWPYTESHFLFTATPDLLRSVGPPAVRGKYVFNVQMGSIGGPFEGLRLGKVCDLTPRPAYGIKMFGKVPPHYCEADFNEDGFVDNFDLIWLLAHFGTCLTGCDGDVDGDYDVDFADLQGLMSAWGPCAEPPTDEPHFTFEYAAGDFEVISRPLGENYDNDEIWDGTLP